MEPQGPEMISIFWYPHLWTLDDPSSSVGFLDLAITINDGSIVTRTRQRPINLYQYITSNSAHPLGMIKGMVHCLLRRYYHRNSHGEDYWKMAMMLLYSKRLNARGWGEASLLPTFVAAHEKICSRPQGMKF